MFYVCKEKLLFCLQEFFFLIKGFLNLNEKIPKITRNKAYLMKKFMFLFSCLRILSLVIKNLFWSLNLLSGILQHLYYRMMIVERESNLIKMWSVDHGHSWGFKHSDPEYRNQFFDIIEVKDELDWFQTFRLPIILVSWIHHIYNKPNLTVTWPKKPNLTNLT